MASVYTNDLRLEEIGSGEQSGTWGDTTNTNLELIAEAFAYGTETITTNANAHATTIADGGSDPGRAMFLEYKGSLDSPCTITLGPPTVSKLWFIKNSTAEDLIIIQGTGGTVANSRAVTIPAGNVKAVYSDGEGASAAKIVDAFTGLNVPSLFVKNPGTGDDSTALLTLQTAEADVQQNDVLGKISFQAPNEGQGTDAVLIAAAIQAVSEGDFSSSNNATSLAFMTGASEAAATKMTLSSAGDLTLTSTTASTSSTTGSLIVGGGVGIAADLFVGDDFDVTGDAVIDGTALVTGVLTTTAATVFNGGFAANEVSTITDATSFSSGLSIINTADEHGSVIDFFNNSSTPANDDYLGGLIFKGTHSNGGTHSFAKIFGQAIDITDTTEDGAITFETSAAGANTAEIMRITNASVDINASLNLTSTAINIDFMETGVTDSNHRIRQNSGNLSLGKLSNDKNTFTENVLFDGGAGTIFNNGEVAGFDFRVASDSQTHMLFVDAGQNAIGINATDLPADMPLTITNKAHVSDFSLVALGIGGVEADDAVGVKSSIGFGYVSAARPIMPAVIAYETKSTSGGTFGDLVFATRPDVGNTQPTVRMTIKSDGKIGIGTSDPIALTDNVGGLTIASNGPCIVLKDANNANSCTYIANNSGILQLGLNADNGGSKVEIAQFGTFGAVFNEGSADLDFRVESDDSINAFVVNGANDSVSFGKATDGLTDQGSAFANLQANGHHFLAVTNTSSTANNSTMYINRQTSDGKLILLRHANADEGSIEVDGNTVSFNGFSGRHESSGIAANTAVGTVVSTIDELDVYPDTQSDVGDTVIANPKAGQTRANHAKVKVSDAEGDACVYGVVAKFTEQDKVIVTSVGIGSVRVTGSCAKGDLLESNGDGTAKVQSDDIVRSKTLGKVTIGNSNTGVKLVSCVMYCG